MSEFTIDTYANDGRTKLSTRHLDPIEAWCGKQCPFYITARSFQVEGADERAKPKYEEVIKGKEYDPAEKAGHWNRIFANEMEIACRHLY